MRITASEGWFCPGCQAFHAPHVDTCELANHRDKFVCSICGRSDEKATRCDRSDCKTHMLVNMLSSRELN